jgi:hypothetical protein
MRAGTSLVTVAGMIDLIDACRIVLNELLSWLRGPRPTTVVPVSCCGTRRGRASGAAEARPGTLAR